MKRCKIRRPRCVSYVKLAAARLRGAHIARVTDYGKLESGEPYSVIEYLEGKDLSEVLKEAELPISHAVEYMCQACEALIEAHGQGIIHRDIKPSNLFLTRTPSGKACIKVLDFGISKFTLAGDESLELAKTSTQAVIGSPLYMSPEQMRASRDVDVRSDVWALGVTLYQLLTGRVPFVAETMMELCMKVANDEPPPLREARPEVPAPLEAIVLRCLRRNPEERFQTVLELQTALAPFAAHGRASVADIVLEVAAPRGPDSEPPSAAEPHAETQSHDGPATEYVGAKLAATDPTWGKTQGDAGAPRKRRSAWMLGAAAAAGAVGLLGWRLLAGADAAPGSETEPATEPIATASSLPPAQPERSEPPVDEVDVRPTASIAPSASTATQPPAPAPTAAKTPSVRAQPAVPKPAVAPKVKPAPAGKAVSEDPMANPL